MDGDTAVKILMEQRDQVGSLRNSSFRSAEFAKWRRDTEVAIEKVFTASSRHSNDFKELKYTPSTYSLHNPDPAFHRAYLNGLSKAEAVIASMVDEVKKYGFVDETVEFEPSCLLLVEKLCLSFHRSARQLRSRHADRSTLEVNDEYDVQDLLHAFLLIHFEDIRHEEWSPSYAGSASRVDFLLKQERIVVEVKKTRPGLTDAKLGEQLLIDRERYGSHPDCDTLVCFVYDPDGRVRNPAGVARDLEDHSGPLVVRVIIAP